MKTAGKFLLVASTLLGLYSLVIFDPSVHSGEMRVVNLQRLSTQQNLIIVSVGLAIVGVLLMIFGPKTTEAH